jgi:hypothetical protein
MPLTKQERRIYETAEAVVPKLKRHGALDLPGGRWELTYDFAKTPRLLWTYASSGKEPFAIIPSERRVEGLGALGFGYAEKKLKQAAEELGARIRH